MTSHFQGERREFCSGKAEKVAQLDWWSKDGKEYTGTEGCPEQWANHN